MPSIRHGSDPRQRASSIFWGDDVTTSSTIYCGARGCVLLSAPKMTRTELYHGLFEWHADPNGQAHLSRGASRPTAVPRPTTGRPLRVSTIEADSVAICPSCSSHGRGGFVSFEGDLRMAYACPACRQLV